MKNARTTFTEFNHPPDLGNPLSSDGKMAKMVNGSAKATENPSIPIIGLKPKPREASISTFPNIGPTQDRLTNINVKAMKNEPTNPPFSTLLSVFVVKLLGSVISNRPKNDAANAIKSRKKIILGIQCEVRTVAKFGLRPNNETNNPIEVYMAIIERPKTRALIIDFKRPDSLFRKNETVIGIIG